MSHLLRKHLGPGVLFLLGAALQLFGIRNAALAWTLIGVALVWVLAVDFRTITAFILRRAPAPPEPAPSAPPQALFGITLPCEPRPGNIDNYRTIIFENVYVVTSATRELRFELTSPGRQFLGSLEYHEIWREHAAASADFAAKYMSNPAHIQHPHRSGHLAFIDRTGNRQGISNWTLFIETGLDRDRQRFPISSIGEWTCYDDGRVGRASAPGSSG